MQIVRCELEPFFVINFLTSDFQIRAPALLTHPYILSLRSKGVSSRWRQRRFRPFTLKKLTDTAKVKSIILYDFLERMTTLPKMCLLSMGMNIEVGNPEMLLAPPPPSYRRFIFMAALRQKLGWHSRLWVLLALFLWVSLKDVVQPI